MGLEIYKIYLLIVIIKEWGCFARQKTRISRINTKREKQIDCSPLPGQKAPRTRRRRERKEKLKYR
ncbi:MAG: hypothetical protein ACUZ8N_02600 [Candidatus Scalindua sp.]